MLERTDKTIFYGSLAVLFFLVAPMLVYSQESHDILLQLKISIENTFGSIYQYLTVIVMVFILWLAISRYGDIRLGKGPYHFNTLSTRHFFFLLIGLHSIISTLSPGDTSRFGLCTR